MARTPVHFWNPLADWTLAGGASIAFCGAALAIRPQHGPALLAVLGALMWLLHWPHIAASLYRLVFWREHGAAYPWAVWIAPAVIAVGTLAAFVSPTAFAPAWVRVAVWWLAWHVAEQAAVLSEAYSRRAGRRSSEHERLMLRTACAALALYYLVRLESPGGPSHLFGVALPGANLPGDASLLAAVAAGVGFASWLVAVFHDRAAGWPPSLAFLPLAALGVWFCAAGRIPGVQVALPLFHGAQYLLLCGVCQVGEEARHGAENDAVSEGARWGAVVVALGAFIGAGLPGGAVLLGADFAFAFGVFWASAQLYHFVADAVLWRWEDPRMAARIVDAAARAT
ncbi:MAG: hypothetical protein HY553_02745 [Elusimicrobia bacterium]|nr:hypothetical protein [Elusimicrobiota bacterium]